ncbi:alpha/beta fold hydrolase [Neptuniibacter sp. QD37_11]|uniref:alpha/beta fold hydrolase n=1 Tax=Neptuniibacter sp. QD37_11 TaxID=3398209 RepID=UPI0039F50083
MDPVSLSLDLNHRYQGQCDRLNQLPECNVTGRYQATSLGPIWVMEAGPEDAPRLIALHGLHTPAPFNLELLWPLTKHFRVISPDIPGQAGKTPGIAPVPSNSAYAMWLDQLLDALGVEQAPMVGLSFGGAVLLDLAAYKPERISAASLIVPAGFSRPLWRPLKKLILPFIGFKIHTDQPHFDQLMKPLMEDNWPELEQYYYSTFQAGIPMTLIPPGPFSKAELSRFKSPVQIFSASEDIYFDPDQLAEQARSTLVNLKQLKELEDLHIPCEENRRLIQEQVVAFMRNEIGM